MIWILILILVYIIFSQFNFKYDRINGDDLIIWYSWKGDRKGWLIQDFYK